MRCLPLSFIYVRFVVVMLLSGDVSREGETRTQVSEGRRERVVLKSEECVSFELHNLGKFS